MQYAVSILNINNIYWMPRCPVINANEDIG